MLEAFRHFFVSVRLDIADNDADDQPAETHDVADFVESGEDVSQDDNSDQRKYQEIPDTVSVTLFLFTKEVIDHRHVQHDEGEDGAEVHQTNQRVSWDCHSDDQREDGQEADGFVRRLKFRVYCSQESWQHPVATHGEQQASGR